MTTQRGEVRLQENTQITQGGAGLASGARLTRGQQADTYGYELAQTIIEEGAKGLDAGRKIYNKKVAEAEELDIERQRSNALMEKAEDAETEKGKIAYAMVGAQNEVLATTKRLENMSKDFRGTREEWDEVRAAELRTLYDKVQNDYGVEGEEAELMMLKMTNQMFGEQAVRLTAVRAADELEQQRKDRINTFTDNLILRTEGLEGEGMAQVVSTLMTQNKEALQMTDTEAEQVLMQAAIAQAAQGDLRLIKFTEEYTGQHDASLYDRTPQLQEAKLRGERFNKNVDAHELANSTIAITDGYMSDTNSWEQTNKLMDMQDQKYGYSVWPEQRRVALKNAKMAQLSKKADAGNDLDLFSQGVVIESVEGDTARNDRTLEAAKDWVDQAVTAGYMTKAEGEQWYYTRLGRSELKDKELKNRLGILENYNIENIDPDGELPQEVKDTLALAGSLTSGTRDNHTTAKGQAIWANYQLGKSMGQNDATAFRNASQAANQTKAITPKQKEEVLDFVDDAVDELTYVNWYDNIPLVGGIDSEEAYVERLRGMMYDFTMANMNAGYIDPEMAAKDALKALQTNYTRLDNGNYVFGTQSQLARDMRVAPEDVGSTFDMYLQIHQATIEDEGGDIETAYFETIPHKGTFIVRDGASGVILLNPQPLSELKKGRDEYTREQQRQATVDNYEANLRTLEAGREAEINSMRHPFSGYIHPEVESRINAEYDAKVKEAEADYKRAAESPAQLPYEQEETVPEDTQRFNDAMKKVENEERAGYNPEANVWIPHKSPEGGADTIAYGHKLTQKEIRSGEIVIDGKSYRYRDGESMISDQVADKLYEQDLANARDSLVKSWPDFESLEPKYQRVLKNIAFNVGQTGNSVSPETWPELAKAINEKDDKKVREEMLTKYKKEDGEEYIALERRRDILSKAILQLDS